MRRRWRRGIHDDVGHGSDGGRGRDVRDVKRPPEAGRHRRITEDPDAYEIALTTEDGAEVTTILPPGEYRLEINDLSTIHNFHLRGRYAGADVVTDVAGTGEKTAIVLLNEPESYIYSCDAHPARMNATFSIHDRIRTQN
jgi:hypothetical protein